jgi:N-acetylmuramoyl-L-alanine amidase
MIGRLLTALALVAAGASSASGQAARVLGVRHHSDPERTRVVIDLNVSAGYEVRAAGNPERLIIEVLGCDLQPEAPRQLGDGRIRRIRLNNLPARAQVVLDLTARHEYRAFALPAGPDHPFRVVVDVLQPVPQAADPLAPREQGEAYVVVIDAGHGGRDPGTRGCGIAIEKDVALGIAKQAAASLALYDGLRVVLTRGDDRFVALGERVAIARRSRGDLFVCIHANSAQSRRAQGAEVFFLSPRGATDQAASELADRENAAMLVGIDEGQSNDSDLMSILMDLRGSAILRNSELLAGLALGEIEREGHVAGRSVKQASFAVLRTLAMPSILVEAGFLSNPQEARHLRSAQGQSEMGAALAHAVAQYLQQYGEKKTPVRALAAQTHTVRSGETLWTLARTYHTSVTALRSANDLRTTQLRVGQRLVVP